MNRPSHKKLEKLRQRAKNLYLRGRSYALRVIELKQENFIAGLRQDPRHNFIGIFSTGHSRALLVFPVLGCGNGRRQVRHGDGG